MTIEEFDRRPNIEEVALKPDPFYIWLDTRTRLKIEKNDTAEEIGEVLQEHWGLKPKRARAIARYYFSLRTYLRTGNIVALNASRPRR